MSTVFFGNLKIFRFFGFSGFEFRGSGFGFRGSGFGFRFRGSGLIDFTVKFALVIHGKACRTVCKRLLHGTKLCCMQYGTQMYAVRNIAAARYGTRLFVVRNMAVHGMEHGCLRYGTRLFAVRNMAARGTEHGCSRYGTWLFAIRDTAARGTEHGCSRYGSGRLDIAARKEYNWPARSGVRCT